MYHGGTPTLYIDFTISTYCNQASHARISNRIKTMTNLAKTTCRGHLEQLQLTLFLLLSFARSVSAIAAVQLHIQEAKQIVRPSVLRVHRRPIANALWIARGIDGLDGV